MRLSRKRRETKQWREREAQNENAIDKFAQIKHLCQVGRFYLRYLQGTNIDLANLQGPVLLVPFYPGRHRTVAHTSHSRFRLSCRFPHPFHESVYHASVPQSTRVCDLFRNDAFFAIRYDGQASIR